MSPNTQFLSLQEAQTLLAEFGIVLNLRQIKRAAEPNAHGKRKLPFFVDPIEGKLRIEKSALLGVYRGLMKSAENNAITLE